MKSKKDTTQAPTGLATKGPAPVAVLHGTDTPPLSETPEIVQERYKLSLEVKRAERRMQEIDTVLKLRTGQRQTGEYLVTVSSFTVDRLDVEAVREILGDATPTKPSVSVRLTVVPA